MSIQKSLTIKQILQKKSEYIQERINANVTFIANKILRLLGKNVNHGSNYRDGEGISPEDQYPRSGVATTMVKDSWRKYRNNRLKNGSVGYIFRNDAKHAKYLFGGAESSGVYLRGTENAKFRSAKRHLPTYYRGKKVTRANQLTSKKWQQFLKYAKKLLKEGALGGITTK